MNETTSFSLLGEKLLNHLLLGYCCISWCVKACSSPFPEYHSKILFFLMVVRCN
uniref:Uncharacterized protein n=1 Tax=Rhizophora mucronata TaxID=61149 RepID=A0A2P2P9X7_RHIMU